LAFIHLMAAISAWAGVAGTLDGLLIEYVTAI
jgi:hypothetical protein